MMRKLIQRTPGIILIIVLLALWQFAVTARLIDTPSFPKVTDIFSRWAEMMVSGDMLEALVPTLRRVAVGYVVAVGLAVPLGAMMGSNRFFFNLFEPVTELLRPIPSAAYVPVAILLLGVGDSMKVTVIAVACFFPVLLNTYGGVRGCDRILIDTGRTFGYGSMARLRKVVLPSALPDILTGMRISLGIGLIVTIIAEMLGGNDGMGYLILNSQRVFRIPEMFAAIFMLGAVGYLLNLAFVRVESYVLRWRHVDA